MNGTVMQNPPLSSVTAQPPPSHLPSSSTLRSPLPVVPSPLPLLPPGSDHHSHQLSPPRDPAPLACSVQIERVRLSDFVPHEGVPDKAYLRAVEALSVSLTRHNAVAIVLDAHDVAIVRCGLESVRMYSKAKTMCSGFGRAGSCGSVPGGGIVYRSGRSAEDRELYPPCMGEIFKCLGKAARASLCAIARHLHLRSDIFNNLLDDTPLQCNEVSSSMLIAGYCETSFESGKAIFGRRSSTREVEKGLLTLIASDNPGIQVCDPNGRWFLADRDLVPGDLLLLTGRSLCHVTAGLRPAAPYRNGFDHCMGTVSGGRAALAFRLMPHGRAILDCSPVAASGHVIPQCFVPVPFSQFMDDFSTEEDTVCNHPNHTFDALDYVTRKPSLRSILSDPLSGMLLEDAMVVSCGHSFGGRMLKKVTEMGKCILCDSEIEKDASIPNHALRAAAAAVKDQDDRRLFHNATLRKRRKEAGEEALKRLKENVAGTDSARNGKGVQYPFAVDEKVVIMGNRRTPDKFVGKEAIITSQCLNGWYLLQTLDSGESVRLQYRSLQKISNSQDDDTIQAQVQ